MKQDCADDVDCGDQCTPSLTCTPSSHEGFTTRVPGRVWDSPDAFPNYTEAGTEVPFFFPSGKMHLKSTGVESKDVLNDKKFSFVNWKAKGLARRTENCMGNATLG